MDKTKFINFQHLCNELNIKDSEGKALAEDNIYLGGEHAAVHLR